MSQRLARAERSHLFGEPIPIDLAPFPAPVPALGRVAAARRSAPSGAADFWHDTVDEMNYSSDQGRISKVRLPRLG